MDRNAGVIVLAAFLATSCDGGPGSGAGLSEIVRQDSMGIEIVEVPGAMLDSLPVWRLSEEPVLSIGEMEAENPYMLNRVAGAVRLEGGTIMIADGSFEIRYFGADGSFMHAVGGRGEGPGEFRRIDVVAPHEAGALIMDAMQRRMTVLDAAGQIVTTEPRPRDGCQRRISNGVGNINCAPRGALSDGTVVTAQVLYGAQPGMATPPQVTEGLMTFVGLNHGNGIVEVDSLPRAAEALVMVEMDADDDGAAEDEIPFVGPRPFDAGEALAIGRRQIALGTGDRLEIRFRDASGALARILRVHRAAMPVTREHLDAFAERASFYGTVLDAAGAADSVPHFRRLLLDDADRLWVNEYPVGPDEPAWMVFDASGIPSARVQLPSGLTVYQIGEDFVLGRENDDLGVQRVVMYTIEKTPGPG